MPRELYMKRKILRLIIDYLLITIGCALYAVAFCWFFKPNAISVGGFTGISQILNYLIPVLPIGITTLVLNIPLFIIGIRLQGVRLLISSLYCMTISSIFIDLISMLHEFAPMNDLLLASIFGGVLAGAAVGLEMRYGATSGGTELAARLLKFKFRHISVGKLCLMVDLLVILMYSLVFRQIYNALYGVVAMYIFSIAVDFVIYGGTHAKMAYIISNESEAVKKRLLTLDLGVTMLNGKGGWQGDDKQLVLCAFKRNQIHNVESAVTEIDPSAFIIVCDTHEVVGEGFGTYSPGKL